MIADLRDVFLSKLISGELPVKDAERIVEAARNVSMILRHLSFEFSVRAPRLERPVLVC